MLFVVNTRALVLERRPMAWAVLLSVLTHLAFLGFVHLPNERDDNSRITVSLLEMPVEKKIDTPPTKELPRQIVSPSENQDTPPTETRLLSEHDSQAAHEQIKRGDGGGQPSQPQPERRAAKQPLSEPKEAEATPNKMVASVKPNLFLKNKTVLEKVLNNAPSESAAISQPSALERELSGSQSTQSDEERLSKFQNYEPFAHQSLKRLLSGNPGEPDYLPNVPDGDITLLNAKADRFAVFVRRVAIQVFGALRRESWDRLPFGEVQRIRGFITAEATLSPDGKLLQVSLRDSSGSASFDKIVVSATQDGAWDQNPPPGARAADGNYHFIFKARTWARGAASGPGEQRWLLLGTGLL